MSSFTPNVSSGVSTMNPPNSGSWSDSWSKSWSDPAANTTSSTRGHVWSDQTTHSPSTPNDTTTTDYDGGHFTTSKFVSNSDDERREYIRYLQQQTTPTMLPAMVFIITMATVGVVGNSLALYVFGRKFSLNATRVFILAIAVFDLITNVIVIPGEVYEMFHTWDYEQPLVCRAHSMTNALTTMVSALLLCALAGIRYRKVGVPHGKQLTVKQAKIVVVVLIFLSILLSSPNAIINGRQTKPTPRSGIYGYECAIDDNYVGTIWPLVSALFLMLGFILTSLLIIVTYTIIGIKGWCHRRRYILSERSSSSTCSRDDNLSTSSDSSNEPQPRSSRKQRSEEKSVQHLVTYETNASLGAEERENGYKNSTFRRISSSVRISTTTKSVFYSKRRKSNKKRCTKSESDKDRRPNGDLNSGCNERPNGDLHTGRNEERNENNTIEYFTDEDELKPDISVPTGDAERKGIQRQFSGSKMICAPKGASAQVNLSMVRELTVKLRAVQKQNSREDDTNDASKVEANGAKGDENSGDSLRSDDSRQPKPSLKSVQFVNDNITDHSSEMMVCKSTGSPKEVNEKVGENLEVGVPVCNTKNQESRSNSVSQTRSTNVTNESKGKALSVPDLNDARGSSEGNEIEKCDARDDGVSDFVKAMQWVDITYCLKGDSAAAETEESPSDKTYELEHRGNSLSKKNSFQSKLSRDNSFLRKHSNIRASLAAALTKTRRSKAKKDAKASKSGSMASLKFKDAPEKRSSTKPVKKVILERKHARRLSRTTIMLIVISAVYVIGFLPLMSLMLWKHAKSQEFESLGLLGLVFYNLGLRSYFLNSAANAVIYAICDLTFRRHCFHLIRSKLCCWCT